MKKATKIITLILSLWFGALILIGVYFKLTHIPGADFMLALGLGVETLIIFFIVISTAVSKKKMQQKTPQN